MEETEVINVESQPQVIDKSLKHKFNKAYHFVVHRVKWSNVLIVTTWHCLFVYAYWYVTVHPVKLWTVLFGMVISLLGGIGILCGAHRLWAHKTFKARLPLRILLMLLDCSTMNGPAYSYARDHRQHHKFSDQDGDPKDPRRGLFYSHLGWWLLRKDSMVFQYGAKLDFSDLYDDKVLMFEKTFYVPLFLIFGVAIPTAVPVYCWNEDLAVAFLTGVVFKVTIILHHFFTVNSLAHYFGYRPYDFRIRPAENRLVMHLSMGEGNHNYHHVFPFDYRSAPLQAWEYFNLATAALEIFRVLGLAYDFKKATSAMIEEAMLKKGIGDKALFDKKHSLTYRIIYGILDNIAGLLVVMWWLYPILCYKYFMDLPVFVF